MQLEEVIGSDVIGNACQMAELDIHTATLQDLNKVTVRMGNNGGERRGEGTDDISNAQVADLDIYTATLQDSNRVTVRMGSNEGERGRGIIDYR